MSDPARVTFPVHASGSTTGTGAADLDYDVSRCLFAPLGSDARKGAAYGRIHVVGIVVLPTATAAGALTTAIARVIVIISPRHSGGGSVPPDRSRDRTRSV